MKAMPWKEYLSTLVETFRSYFDEMTSEEKTIAQLNMTFVKPCQIEFFSFENDGQIMLVTLFPDSPDYIQVHEHLGKDFDFSSISKEKLSASIGRTIGEILNPQIENGRAKFRVVWASLAENASYYTFDNLQEKYPDPKSFAKGRFEEVLRNAKDNLRTKKRSTEIKSIADQIEKLNADIKAIKDTSLRNRMLRHTSRMDSSISSVKRLEQHEQRLTEVEQEIGGVRKMIGTTKEYQDFRVFIADLEELKKTHIHKKVFESEIKRVDQRIEDLKAIKFWSKRTVLEIALVIWGTIVTLYASGILKF